MKHNAPDATSTYPPTDNNVVLDPAPRSVDAQSTTLDADPLDWPAAQKWTVVAALSATGFNRIMVSTIMAPPLPVISRDLALSEVQSVLALSIYVLATAFSPLLIGPLSETIGRSPLLHASNVWFLAFNILCGFAPTGPALIIGRFLAGLGAGAIYPLAAGVIGDLWRAEQRGLSLSVYVLFPLLGAAVGPIIGGFVEEYASWRWIFWSTSAFQAVSILVCFVCCRETHLPTLIRRQAGTQPGFTTIFGKSTRADILTHLSTPFTLLLVHPSVQIQAALACFSYGLLYLVLSTFSALFTDQYGQSIAISGLHYIAPCLGEILGSQIGGRLMDKISRRLKRHRKVDTFDPAFHLPIIVPSTFLAGAGLLLYGWSAQQRLPWIAVDIGALVLMCAMSIITQALQAYNIDTYPDLRASTTAAVQVFRSLGAFALPLAGPAMYSNLGYGWANFMLAGIFVTGNTAAVRFLWTSGTRLVRT